MIHAKTGSLDHYSRAAIWLHWIIAALIIFNLIVGFSHEEFIRPVRAWMMYFHKATGITILGLSIVRLLWRLGHRPPPFDAAMHAWEKLLARGVHWLFYALMIAIPLSGWLTTSAAGRPISYFSLFDIGVLPVTQSDEMKDIFEEAHEILAIAMIGLMLLHVAGALKHHFEGHRHMVGRMAPWLYRCS